MGQEAREGLADEVTSEPKLEGGEGAAWGLWGQGVAGRGNSKGLPEGRGGIRLRNSEEARVAGAKWVKGSEEEDKSRDATGGGRKWRQIISGLWTTVKVSFSSEGSESH